MRSAAQGLRFFLRTFACVAGIVLALLGMSACGKDGNITVGVAATKPIPDLPTLTPVRPPTSTPAPPTATVRPTNTPEPSNCCSEHAQPGCDDPVCEACVCDVDPDGFCCGTSGDGGWDANCVDITMVECIDACPCQ